MKEPRQIRSDCSSKVCQPRWSPTHESSQTHTYNIDAANVLSLLLT